MNLARLAMQCIGSLLAMGLLTQAMAQPAAVDVPPDEDGRMRMRGELRRQLHEERMRWRDAHRVHAPQADGGPWAIADRPEALPEGSPSRWPSHRLTPEEREQLRRQLRESRQAGGR